MNPTPISAADELNPYLIVRVHGGRAEFARWRVKDGPDALALFLSSEGATVYAGKALSGPGWQVVRPPRASVLEVLQACYTAGVTLAVLDPDGEQAKRVFPIGEILQAVGIDAPGLSASGAA